MRLIFFGPMGSGPMVLNDDDSKDEIAKAMMIAATTEQGNGSNRSIKKGEKDNGTRTK